MPSKHLFDRQAAPEDSSQSRWWRELRDAAAYGVAFGMLLWSIHANLTDFARLVLPWLLLGFGPSLYGPKRFGRLLLLAGASTAFVYGSNEGFDSTMGFANWFPGIALVMLGLALTPLTQRMLIALRPLMGLAIIALYVISLTLQIAGTLDTRDGFGFAGMLLLALFVLPLGIRSLRERHAYWRAASTNQGHPASIWDTTEETLPQPPPPTGRPLLPNELQEAIELKQQRRQTQSK